MQAKLFKKNLLNMNNCYSFSVNITDGIALHEMCWAFSGSQELLYRKSRWRPSKLSKYEILNDVSNKTPELFLLTKMLYIGWNHLDLYV